MPAGTRNAKKGFLSSMQGAATLLALVVTAASPEAWTEEHRWDFGGGDVRGWSVVGGLERQQSATALKCRSTNWSCALAGPAFREPASSYAFITVRMSSNLGKWALLYYTRSDTGGKLYGNAVALCSDGRPHEYNVAVDGSTDWRETITGIPYLKPTNMAGDSLEIEYIALTSVPLGSMPDIRTWYFGVENATNRINEPC